MNAADASSEFLVVLITAPDADTAAQLGKALVEERLAACVNILPGIRSLYTWQGKVADEAETLCLVKTRRALYPAVRQRIEAIHPYDVPEIVALPISEGNAPYLEWLRESTRG